MTVDAVGGQPLMKGGCCVAGHHLAVRAVAVHAFCTDYQGGDIGAADVGDETGAGGSGVLQLGAAAVRNSGE